VFYFPNSHPNKKQSKSAAERKRESRAKAKAQAEEQQKEERDNHAPKQDNPVMNTEDPAMSPLISTL
jgi:hypothetical protein